MRKRVDRLLWTVMASLVLIVLALAGCGGSSSGDDPVAQSEITGLPPTSSTQNVTLQPGVLILSESSLSGAEVTEDGSISLTRSNLAEVPTVGSVIVSGVTASTPSGLLRRVVGVSNQGGVVRLQTEQASLEDVIFEGELAISGTLAPDPSVSEQGGDDVRAREIGEIELSFDDIPGLGAGVELEGETLVRFNYDLKADFRSGKLENFQFTLRGHQDLRLILDVTGTVELADIERELKKLRLGAFTIPIPAGPVTLPVVIQPELTLSAAFKAKVEGGLRYEVAYALDMEATARLNGRGELRVTPTRQQAPTPRVIGKASAKLTVIKPKVTFKVYGVTGPHAELTCFVEGKVEPLETPWGTLKLGVEGDIGLKLTVFKKTAVDVSVRLLTWSRQLWSSGGPWGGTGDSGGSNGTGGGTDGGGDGEGTDGGGDGGTGTGGDGGGTDGGGDGGTPHWEDRTIERVSLSSTGEEANESSGTIGNLSISADGRYVAFGSAASNLVEGDTNGIDDIFMRDRQTEVTTRVSVNSAGGPANSSYSYVYSISADGRYVAFQSDASNLVPGDTNNTSDIFVHDRQAGTTTRVSVNSAGEQGNRGSHSASLSANGRYMAFQSDASNLVEGDTNNTSDIFVHDRQTSVTTRVSVNSSGEQGDSTGDQFNRGSYGASLSADGRYVIFASHASNLVEEDTNDASASDIFVHDRQTRVTTRVSVNSSGEQGNYTRGGLGNHGSYNASISVDGRYVAFQSDASNLVPGDTNGEPDIFVHDSQTGVTTRVSVNSAGEQGNRVSYGTSLSADGRYVAFGSSASNLVEGDTNGVDDIFVRDRQTGITTRVSVDSSGNQGNNFSIGDNTHLSISADGRFVAFVSSASNLVPDDTNGDWDIFVSRNPLAP